MSLRIFSSSADRAKPCSAAITLLPGGKGGVLCRAAENFKFFSYLNEFGKGRHHTMLLVSHDPVRGIQTPSHGQHILIVSILTGLKIFF